MRIGVFGAGLIGRKHAELVARRGHLIALVDPDPKAKALAQQLGCTHYPSPEACLDAAQLDGVIIATPNQMHVEHARLCMSLRLPMLIEKPISGQASDARALVAESESLGIPILVGHHRRHNPKAQRAARAMREGDLGKIVAVTGHFLLYKPDEYFDVVWRRLPGAGPVFINLIHDVDLMRFFVGEVTEVMAMQSSEARDLEVEDTASLMLRFENGALGSFVLSDAAVSPWSWEFTAAENSAYPNVSANAYQIAGTHGALSVPDLRLWRHPQKRSWWEPMESRDLTAENGDPFERQFSHFLKVCEGATPLVSAREGLRSLEVVEAVKQAATTGTLVKLDHA
ncbi:4-carboxy-2-hydroxymuconate-6-semialdehyde dehydrogenase [Shimia sp. SK013]|uniref:Gfo/Idh/MocA family protein n=1 Tax=Shimia sp. SK013 TaxID=1389006 RepID=UPI0006B4F96F|nr:Gfo/Idh/MocA family oxidoreductase [Shimia sp. SK013]KPA20570.1 4-carboxy-2-hydroxymuconate-6-semialdehyde dehydrogenase [Shimia sp. SK013]